MNSREQSAVAPLLFWRGGVESSAQNKTFCFQCQ
jgi:hypothetical protein